MLNFTPPTGTILGLTEWAAARQACQAISPGSDLAYFDSLAQQNTVVNWANTVKTGKPVNEGFFIGLQCTGPTGALVSEGCTWKWANTNTAPSYADWFGSVPYVYISPPQQMPLGYYPFCGLVVYRKQELVRQQVGGPILPAKVVVDGWINNPCSGAMSLGTVALCRIGNCTP